MLASGALSLVTDAAKQLGITLSSRTALRWKVHGRAGEPLPTVRVRGRLYTTVEELRSWLARTEARRAGRQQVDVIDRAAESKVLDSFGLGAGGNHE